MDLPSEIQMTILKCLSYDDIAKLRRVSDGRFHVNLALPNSRMHEHPRREGREVKGCRVLGSYFPDSCL